MLIKSAVPVLNQHCFSLLVQGSYQSFGRSASPTRDPDWLGPASSHQIAEQVLICKIIYRTYPGELVRGLVGHTSRLCFSVSGPSYSVHESWEAIYFLKAMTNIQQLLHQFGKRPNFETYQNPFWYFWEVWLMMIISELGTG